jgi:hypothetical protein
VAAVSVVLCLVLASLMIVRDAGKAPSAGRWSIGLALLECLLWITAALVVAPTLWGLLS